jgi:sugar-specific transcriptional regulator TrmB
MIASIKVLDALKSIGLNLYERKIYVALLAKCIATAGEVSEIAKVPRSRSYDVLESLADKGFVVAQPSKPIRYVALAPKDALDRSQENLKVKHEEIIERIERLRGSDIMKELDGIYKDGFSMVQPFEMTGTLKGSRMVSQQLHSLFKQSKKSVHILTTETGFTNLASAHFSVLKKASGRGVKIRIAAPMTDKTAMEKFSKIAELKNIENPGSRMVMVDDEHAVVALTDDGKVHQTQDVVFWANSAHMVKSIVNPMFAGVWKS